MGEESRGSLGRTHFLLQLSDRGFLGSEGAGLIYPEQVHGWDMLTEKVQNPRKVTVKSARFWDKSVANSSQQYLCVYSFKQQPSVYAGGKVLTLQTELLFHVDFETPTVSRHPAGVCGQALGNLCFRPV